MPDSQALLSKIRRRAALQQNQRRIAHMARQVAAHAPQPDVPHSQLTNLQSPITNLPSLNPNSPIAFFNATARLGGFTLNAGFDLLTSWSLRLSGMTVKHFVCHAGMTHCVLGTNSNDLTQPPPCKACIAQSHRLYTASDVVWFTYQPNPSLADALEDLSVADLSAFTAPIPHFALGTSHIAKPQSPITNHPSLIPNSQFAIPLGPLVLPSVRWALRRHHLIDDAPTRNLLREYILSAYSLAAQFAGFLQAVKPGAAVIFNGILYPEATARWVARQLGVRNLAFEVGFQPFSAFFTDGEPTAYPVQLPDDFALSEEQSSLLDAQLEKRFQGKFSMAGIRFWPEMRGLDQAFLDKAAGFRQMVPVFTNVVYDSSQVHANTLFTNMFDWLDLLLESIPRHPETLFVIRAHPDEKRPVSNKISNESVHDWVYLREVNLLPNVVFIEPDEFISSYEIIQRAKFVLVYNSSIGLEASLMGAPVICGGKARYTQVPTVFLPESPAALQELTEEFLDAGQIQIPPEFQRNARRFLYYQFYRISLSMSAFLREGEKQGFVYLKPFSWQALLPENSPTMKILKDGILEGNPFLTSDL